MKRKSGTKQWSRFSENVQTGCKGNCRYCYAAYDAIHRFHRVKDRDAWKEPILNRKKLNKKIKKYNGRVMYPTTHDIHLEFIEENIEYLRGLLEVGNEVLIVSKPDLTCIGRICDELAHYKKQLTFRFTFGSLDQLRLDFWDPGAPTYNNRELSLMRAWKDGFKTSVSNEPYLDNTTIPLFHRLKPYITDTFWVGFMRNPASRVDKTGWGGLEWVYMNEVLKVSGVDHVRYLYAMLKNEPKIRWKESIQEMLQLEGPDEIG